MSNLLKVAKKLESKIQRYADAGIFSQLSALSAAAQALFKGRHVWQNAALGTKYDASDIYSDDAEAPKRAAKVLQIVDSIYYAANGLKNDASNYGMSAADMANRKNQILGYCKALQGSLATTDSAPWQLLEPVRVAAEQLTPAAVQAANPQIMPEMNIGGDRPTGSAFTQPELESEEESNMTSVDPSQNQSKLY